MIEGEWTQEEIDVLLEKWQSGYTASEISRQMPGRNRNMVMGKIHRLRDGGANVEKRPSPIKRPASPLHCEQIVAVEKTVAVILEKDNRYCAEPGCEAMKFRGSYCAHHAAIYYKAPRPKNEEPEEFHSGYEKARRNF